MSAPARPALLGVALLCILHFGSFEILASPIVWDTRYYLYYASRVAHGDVPYRDFFELKTPLSMFVGALFHRIGQALGLLPVHAIRAGYMALAAAAGLALFAVHRRLASGRLIPGLIALCVYMAFPLMGLLPAVGVLPKTLMALFASLAALAVEKRRWLVAGACGALAFLDWQVGGLVAVAAVVGALGTNGRRGGAVARVVAGGLLVLTPLAAYFLATGGLTAALGQTLGTLLDRGDEVAAKQWSGKLAVISRNVDVGCDGQEWLFAIGVAGMIVYLIWLWRRRRHESLGMALSLGVYHYGLVGFSLFDFQSYPDLYILLYSMSFFAAVVLVEAHARVRAFFGPGRVRMIDLGAAVLALAMARPSLLAAHLDLTARTVDAGATLSDQLQVYDKVMAVAAGRRVTFLGPAELPFLGGIRNAAPFVYWDSVAYSYYRHPGEEYLDTRNRLLRLSGADLLVGDRTLPPEPGDQIIASDNGTYRVVLRAIP